MKRWLGGAAVLLVAVFAAGVVVGVLVGQAPLAEKEVLVSALQADIDTLRSDLGRLKAANAALLASVEASLSDASDIAKSNRTSLEKLRSVIQRLEGLRATLNSSPP